MSKELFERLEKAVRDGDMEPLDLEFAKFLERLDPKASDHVILAGCLASHAVSRSSTCIDFGQPIETGCGWLEWAREMISAISLDELRECIASSPLVAHPTEQIPAPLIFEDGRRLYLQRYHRYETILASCLSRLASRDYVLKTGQIEDVRKVLSWFFKGQDKCDWQRVAVATAVLKGLCIVSGGPGTGKTRTVAAIIAGLKAAWRENAIAVAAPTGKAATRLRDSIHAVLSATGLLYEMDLIQETYTLHRLLGADARGRFRYGPGYPLPYDTIIVDEASMVDLPMMSKLVSALSPDARLILLGDKDQLASVEAGNVLSDICSFSRSFHYSAGHASSILELSGDNLPLPQVDSFPLRDCIVELKKNFRFDSKSPISEVAKAISAGDHEKLIEILIDRDIPYARLMEPSNTHLSSLLAERSNQHFLPCIKAASPLTGLDRLQDFRILCAHRTGLHGTNMVNKTISHLLLRQRSLPGGTRFFQGQPLIILKNSYRYAIFNGDICIVWPDTTGKMRAWFQLQADTCRHLPLNTLPEHDTAFAITVHKSQGSEFDRIFLVLPDEDSPLLTRELLYTAVTRAREGVEIWGTKDALKKAVSQRVKRSTGLRAKLFQDRQQPSHEDQAITPPVGPSST